MHGVQDHEDGLKDAVKVQVSNVARMPFKPVKTMQPSLEVHV